MTVLGNSRVGVFPGYSPSFDFTTRREFKGSVVPEAVDIGLYYRPKDEIVAAIDSFGVDSGGDAFFFSDEV